MKKQEPEQASRCPEEYPKDRNNVYLNEATIVAHGTLRVKQTGSEVTTNISQKKSKYSCTRLIFRPSPSRLLIGSSTIEYSLRLKVSSTITQKSCTRVHSSTSAVLEYSIGPSPLKKPWLCTCSQANNSEFTKTITASKDCAFSTHLLSYSNRHRNYQDFWQTFLS